MKVARNVSAPKKKRSSAKARQRRRSSGRRWRTILVPLDFSPASLSALEEAIGLAETHGAKLILVNVVVPVAAPDLVYGPVAWDDEAAMACAKDKMAELKTGHASDLVRRARAVVRRGHPHQEIDAVAKEAGADLMVISTHGRTGFRHMLLGSIAERVIRHTPCPVLVLRQGAGSGIA